MKGQITDTPLLYVFIIAIVFVAAFFGVKIILSSVDYQEDVEIQEFFVAFNTKVQKAYISNPGIEVNLGLVEVPKNVEEICYVDFTKEIDYSKVNNNELRVHLENLKNESNNFFIYGKEVQNIIQEFEIENVESADINPVCDLNNNGSVNFKAVSKFGKTDLTLG